MQNYCLVAARIPLGTWNVNASIHPSCVWIVENQEDVGMRNVFKVS